MASEPERPIEQSLRAAARRRREQAGPPFELHPADRRVLQAEVARIFPAAPARGESFWQRLCRPALLPRLAWSLGILLVLAFAVWSLLPANNKVGLVAMDGAVAPDLIPTNALASEAAQGPDLMQPQVDGVTRLEKPENAPSVAAAVPNETSAAKDDFASATADQPKQEESRMAAQARAGGRDVAASNPARETTQSAELFRRRYAANTPGAAAPGTPVAQVPPAASKSLKDSTTAVATLGVQSETASTKQRQLELRSEIAGEQYTIQVDPGPAGAKESPAEGILRSFTLQTSGARVVIQDADQSVYAGYAEHADKLPVGVPEAKYKETMLDGLPANQPLGSAKLDPTNQLTFRVVGTNVSSKEKVVFSGSLVPLLKTNAAGSAAYRIQGSVEVGSRPPVPVQALPAQK